MRPRSQSFQRIVDWRDVNAVYFIKTARDVLRLKQAGEPRSRITAAVDTLPKEFEDPEHTAGLGTPAYKKARAALQQSRAAS